MSNKKSPYLILLEQGSHTWNRWVQTLQSKNIIDVLDLPDRFSKLSPLSPIEQNQLAELLSVNTVCELDKEIIIEGELDEMCLEGYIFPYKLHFKNCALKNSFYIHNSFFLEGLSFIDIEFKKTFSLRGLSISKEFEIKSSIMPDQSAILDCTIKSIASITENDFNEAIIYGCDFEETFSSEKNVFSSYLLIKECSFNADAVFNKCEYNENSEFHNCVFNDDLNFLENTFIGNSSFINSKMLGSTRFDGSSFVYPPRFHNAEIHQDTSFLNSIFYSQGMKSELMPYFDQVRAWCTLKTSMNKMQNHSKELMFFSFEKDCVRKVLWMDRNYIKWFFLLLYKITTDYGRSVGRPIIFFLLLIPLFAFVYKKITCNRQVEFIDSLQLSISNSFPFIPSGKIYISQYIKMTDTGLAFQIISGFQNILSIVLLFVIALAVKNFFSIK